MIFLPFTNTVILLEPYCVRHRAWVTCGKTEEWDFRFWPREKLNKSQKTPPLPAVLLGPFIARSLTLLPRSLTLNHTETLVTQARLIVVCLKEASLASWHLTMEIEIKLMLFI